MNWALMYDCYGDVDRVPELLARAEREEEAEVWDELGYRLILECDLVFPASFAALPCLVRLASRSARARVLAGAIVRCAAGGHGCDDLLAGCAEAIAQFPSLLDRHLRSRPDDYLAPFRDLIAVEGRYHWSAILGGLLGRHLPGRLPSLCCGDDDRHRRIRTLFSDPGLEPGRRGPT
ncbi:hypothetical protein [Streptomyces sp. Wh19]|uniref:hypothetical protein n=1 Tax=Streptomyces sp. Wh19 TaxID=3076629 RepID=UPI002958A378|nr:hypothetical protein [Streptomyces sp. Wh19]MDV9193865.1 hypothetical protein [Streptomyces sp. Wh19]